MAKLILASSSPRRRELLEEAGYNFEVLPPRDGAEPDTIEGLGPAKLVAELARLKGEDVADQFRADAPASGDPTIVLAADTVAECDGRILGKPRDEGDAREMLTWMSGREHHVLTGVCLIGEADDGATHTEVVTTRLLMASLESDWLEPYLASGRWGGKAGAFGYQDGIDFVRITEGSASNVVGLPMERLSVLLAERDCFPAGTRQP